MIRSQVFLCTLALTALGMPPAAAQSSARGFAPQPSQFTHAAFFAASVDDLDASTVWYRTMLGLVQVHEVESRDGRGRARMLRNGELVVELIQYEASRAGEELLGEDAHPLQFQGLFKAGVFVDDAHRLHAALRRLGASVDAEVTLDEALRLNTFVLRDLDGNRIQVFAPCSDCRD
jgi:catechol 2,3-dioxygenase-like lactoylglutathione lyase family enzyme